MSTPGPVKVCACVCMPVCVLGAQPGEVGDLRYRTWLQFSLIWAPFEAALPSSSAPDPAPPTPLALALGLLASLLQCRDSVSPVLSTLVFSALRINLGFWGGMQGTHRPYKKAAQF